MFAIEQSETGIAIKEVCRKMGISEATLYNWKKKYGGFVSSPIFDCTGKLVFCI
jgi:transposase-like protein